MSVNEFKALRFYTHMTQRQYASAIGISYSLVRAIEIGRRSVSFKVYHYVFKYFSDHYGIPGQRFSYFIQEVYEEFFGD